MGSLVKYRVNDVNAKLVSEDEAKNIIKEVTEGRFKPPPGCPPELIQFLQAGRAPDNRPEVPDCLNFQQFLTFCLRQDKK